jgi:tetratricopeptide (TPR) repeat protein
MDDLGSITDILGSRADWAGGAGYALVLGAIDWRRCGINRPVPASLLRALAESRLDARGRAKLADQRTYEAAVAWATNTISGGSPLLQPADPGAFTVNDFVLQLILMRGVAIPEDSWQVAIENASAAELLRIGVMAKEGYGKPEIAARAFRKAADRGDSDEVMEATGYLAWLLQEQGDFAGVKAAWQRLIDSGHPDAAGVWVLLGELFRDQGDVPGAKAAYQQAINSGDPDDAVQAITRLGDLLWEQGDVPGAKAAYQQAINSGRRTAASACVSLGDLLQEQGDIPGAKAAYQASIDSGHYLRGPEAAVRLGKLLMAQGDISGAKAAFQQAIDSGHADAAADARAFLGDLPS